MITTEDVLLAVEEATGTPREEIQSKSRRAEVAVPRFVAAALMYRYCHALPTLKSIGRRLGGRDHSTVIYALKRVGSANEMPATDPHLAASYDESLSRLREMRGDIEEIPRPKH